MTSPQPPVLIYDGDCGFCTTTAKWIEPHLSSDASIAPWQSLAIADFGLTEADVTSAAYWVDRTNRSHRGHLAVAQAIESRGGIWKAAALLRMPPLTWLAAPAYSWIAKNRYRLPGSTDACRLEL